jgi:Zn-dependent oligopeptidase
LNDFVHHEANFKTGSKRKYQELNRELCNFELKSWENNLKDASHYELLSAKNDQLTWFLECTVEDITQSEKNENVWIKYYHFHVLLCLS